MRKPVLLRDIIYEIGATYTTVWTKRKTVK